MSAEDRPPGCVYAECVYTGRCTVACLEDDDLKDRFPVLAELEHERAVLERRRREAFEAFGARPAKATGLPMHTVDEPSLLFTIDVCRTCGRQATWPFCEHRPDRFVPYEKGRLSWCFPVAVRVVRPADFRREMRRAASVVDLPRRCELCHGPLRPDLARELRRERIVVDAGRHFHASCWPVFLATRVGDPGSG